MIRRLILIALVVGVAIGAIAAVAVPEEKEPSPPDERPRIAAPFPRPEGAPPYPKSRTTEIARVGDPAGGPAWAVRTFKPPFGGPFTRTCMQLGRIVDGRFGWIDGDNTFRPTGTEPGIGPSNCGRAFLKAKTWPRLAMTTLAEDLDGTRPRVTLSVAWGVAPEGARTVELRIGDRRIVPRLIGGRTFIEFLPASASPVQVSARFDDIELGATQNGDRKLAPPRLDHARPAIAARAPDPHGGLPWGVAEVPADNGGWCTSAFERRIVGDRLGMTDKAQGLFDEGIGLRYTCNRDKVVLRKEGVFLEVGGGGDTGVVPGSADSPGRIARRTQPGVFTISGRARDDVESVTIATPRDVRTLIPAGRSRSFIAAYDGQFIGGETVVSARFSDGSTRVIDPFGTGP
jgi:hypothetical protein